MSIRIVIADDHPVFRSGLRALLEKESDFKVVGESGTGLETIRLACEKSFDVMLLDINMPGMTGPAIAEDVLRKCNHVAIVILTMYDDEYYLQELFKIGVRGFVLKKSTGTDLIQAIRVAYRGEQYIDPSLTSYLISPYVGHLKNKKDSRKNLLTQREQEICSFLNKEIADKLFISERTVETHRSHIFSKLELKSRAELVRFAIDNNLMKLP
jgi:two-component system response regulator NreC